MNENQNASPIYGFDACDVFKYLWTTYETKMYNPIYFYFKRIQFLFIDTFENSSYFCTFFRPTHYL